MSVLYLLKCTGYLEISEWKFDQHSQSRSRPDMHRVVLSTLFVLCFSLYHAVQVPPGVELTCPPRYRLQALDSKVVEIEVSDNKEECEKMAGKLNAREQKIEMAPSIEVVYKDGQYRANVSWSVGIRGNRLPRFFLINLTFYDIKDLDRPVRLNDTCLVLHVKGKRKIEKNMTNTTAKFYFDCLPLLDEPDIGLVVKLWSLTKQQKRHCRSLRSLPQGKGTCGPNVQCSTDYSFPVSKNAHHYRQCACYVKYQGKPNLDWYYSNDDKKFHIIFTNVPPYLDHATVDIIDETNSYNLYEIDVFDTHGGEINIRSEEYHPGEYTAYVCVKLKISMECLGPGQTESLDMVQIDSDCNYEELYYFSYGSQRINVSKQSDVSFKTGDVTLNGTKSRNNEITYGILAAVAFVGIVTTVIFIGLRIWRRYMHNRCESSSYPTRHSDSPVNDANNLELRERHAVPLLMPENQNINSLSETETMETEFIQTGTMGMETGPTQVNLPRNHSDICTIREENLPESQYLVSDLHSNPVSINKTDQVMFLFHPDSKEHMRRVNIFSQTLLNNYGIYLVSRSTENWQDFAESVFVKYSTVVLVISKGLFELCHNYVHCKQSPQKLLAERNQEIVPCIALEKIQTSIKMRQMPVDASLHVVVFDDQKDILQRFFMDHPYLCQSGNIFFHDFCDTDINSENLEPFVYTFMPMVAKQIPIQGCR